VNNGALGFSILRDNRSRSVLISVVLSSRPVPQLQRWDISNESRDMSIPDRFERKVPELMSAAKCTLCFLGCISAQNKHQKRIIRQVEV
jgi:hypothetical protein